MLLSVLLGIVSFLRNIGHYLLDQENNIKILLELKQNGIDVYKVLQQFHVESNTSLWFQDGVYIFM